MMHLPVMAEGRIALTINSARRLPKPTEDVVRRINASLRPRLSASVSPHTDNIGWVCEVSMSHDGIPMTFSTRVAAGTEPCWEEFRSLQAAIGQTNTLDISIFYADLGSGTKLEQAGSGHLMLIEAVLSNEMLDSWVPLKDQNGRPMGEVHVVLMFSVSGSSQQQQQSSSSAERKSASSVSTGAGKSAMPYIQTASPPRVTAMMELEAFKREIGALPSQQRYSTGGTLSTHLSTALSAQQGYTTRGGPAYYSDVRQSSVHAGSGSGGQSAGSGIDILLQRAPMHVERGSEGRQNFHTQQPDGGSNTHGGEGRLVAGQDAGPGSGGGSGYSAEGERSVRDARVGEGRDAHRDVSEVRGNLGDAYTGDTGHVSTHRAAETGHVTSSKALSDALHQLWNRNSVGERGAFAHSGWDNTNARQGAAKVYNTPSRNDLECREDVGNPEARTLQRQPRNHALDHFKSAYLPPEEVAPRNKNAVSRSLSMSGQAWLQADKSEEDPTCNSDARNSISGVYAPKQATATHGKLIIKDKEKSAVEQLRELAKANRKAVLEAQQHILIAPALAVLAPEDRLAAQSAELRALARTVEEQVQHQRKSIEEEAKEFLRRRDEHVAKYANHTSSATSRRSTYSGAESVSAVWVHTLPQRTRDQSMHTKEHTREQGRGQTWRKREEVMRQFYASEAAYREALQLEAALALSHSLVSTSINTHQQHLQHSSKPHHPAVLSSKCPVVGHVTESAVQNTTVQNTLSKEPHAAMLQASTVSLLSLPGAQALQGRVCSLPEKTPPEKATSDKKEKQRHGRLQSSSSSSSFSPEQEHDGAPANTAQHEHAVRLLLDRAGGDDDLVVQFTCKRCRQLYVESQNSDDACCGHSGAAQHWDFGCWKASAAGRRGRQMRRWACCPDKKLDWGTQEELSHVPHGRHEPALDGLIVSGSGSRHR